MHYGLLVVLLLMSRVTGEMKGHFYLDKRQSVPSRKKNERTEIKNHKSSTEEGAGMERACRI